MIKLRDRLVRPRPHPESSYRAAFGDEPPATAPAPAPPSPPACETETLLWIGDGIAPATPDLIGMPVDVHGRTGVCIAVTGLTITVRWD